MGGKPAGGQGSKDSRPLLVIHLPEFNDVRTRINSASVKFLNGTFDPALYAIGIEGSLVYPESFCGISKLVFPIRVYSWFEFCHNIF